MPGHHCTELEERCNELVEEGIAAGELCADDFEIAVGALVAIAAGLGVTRNLTAQPAEGAIEGFQRLMSGTLFEPPAR